MRLYGYVHSNNSKSYSLMIYGLFCMYTPLLGKLTFKSSRRIWKMRDTCLLKIYYRDKYKLCKAE